MHLCLVSAALPPALDGIGDYTANLAQELAKHHEVSVLCGMVETAPVPDVNVTPAFRADLIQSILSLPGLVRRLNPDWLVLQYCPFAFGRWGLNPFLPIALRRCRRASSGTRIALTVHEPMAWPINWKLRTMNLWQGPQLRALARESDIAFVVVDGWRHRYAQWLGATPSYHLPVGSNIVCANTSRVEARQALGIGDGALLVTIFGQGHHSQQWELVARTCRRLLSRHPGVEVLHLGPRHTWLDGLFQDVRVRSDGYLPADEVSRRLAAADLFLSPFADGVSTRRTTLMAALQHGLPVVGTRGEATDAVLSDANGHALVLAPCDDEDAFIEAVMRLADDPSLRGTLAAGARGLYERSFSWPVIARTLTSVLEEAPRIEHAV